MSHSVRGNVLLGALALAWGSNFLWIKVSLEGFTAVGLTFFRLVIGAVVLFVIVAARRDSLPRGLRTWGHIAVAALVANAAPYLLFALGETSVDSSIAGALNSTAPLWTLFLGVALGVQHRLARSQVLGFVLGFLGCLVIFSPWSATNVDSLGALACLAAAVSYGLSYLYIGKYISDMAYGPVVLAACQILVSSGWLALLLPFGGLVRGIPPLSAWVSLIILGAVGTGLAYVVNYALIRHDGAASASLVSYLLPVVAIALGALFISEPLTWSLVAGTAAVLAGVALSRRRDSANPDCGRRRPS